jgi:CheY-like chemotaxis protein
MPATILIVDDDADIRDALSEALRAEGFDVHEAKNGVEALDGIAIHQPDLVLLDLMMPEMNGWEVLRTLRESGDDVPVVVLSALAGQTTERFLPKPFSLEQLLALTDRVKTPSMRKFADAPSKN